MLFIYNSQQYKELDLKRFFGQKLTIHLEHLSPISRLIKYKDIKHKAF